MFVPRMLGAVTIAFSAAIMARPRLMAGPSGYTDPDGTVPHDTKLLMYAIGVRDMATGALMLTAPTPAAMRAAVAARVACDTGDALVFGTRLPRLHQRLKVGAAATGWAAVCAYSLRHIPAPAPPPLKPLRRGPPAAPRCRRPSRPPAGHAPTTPAPRDPR
ncbi:hypothetical protein LP52_23425 [Streptomonospora alba]|uniref:Uncharacterized protein n=1 Tax=Streptomonospora alba TaxID=183763 RepID=A0A0C2G0A3_9ACTN|nr:hypothetical protein [Streptomonospora alba]KIH96723.1 hypothetical protein LP52_23425 [Streptomonospora alba]